MPVHQRAARAGRGESMPAETDRRMDHARRAQTTRQASELFKGYVNELAEPLSGSEINALWNAAATTAVEGGSPSSGS
jgi:hypothetical protein